MSSFRRRLVRPFIIGTKTSPQTGQIITGSGNSALDELLGGGIPMNSIVLIEEDKHCIYSKVLCKYFLAEGVIEKQEIFLASLDDSPKEIFKKLPQPVFSEYLINGQAQPEFEQLSQDTTSLRIAWRYNDLPYLNVDKSFEEGDHHFNLLNYMTENEVANVSKVLWDGTNSKKTSLDENNSKPEVFQEEEEEEDDESTSATDASCFFSNKLFQNLIDTLAKELRMANFWRICIPSLGSPLWYDDNFGDDLLKFLTILRAFVQNTQCVCFLTMPMHLIAKSICGGFLIFGGFYIFTDTKRVLLSRLLTSTSEQLNSLAQPLFYYLSLGLGVAGTIAVLASVVGFWASCLNTYWFLGFYFSAVALLLLAKSVVCLALTLWPHCLGISLDAMKMVKALQGNYGIPGKEQFTIAMDLAQTRFRCCGMNSEINYDTAMWRLQGFGTREWVVPLTCCILNNEHEPLSYLDPKPFNESQCQTLHKVDFSNYRHTSPCLEYLDIWYREQYLLFFGASLLIVIVEFFVLLSIILNCSKISRGSSSAEDFLETKSRAATSNQTLVENIYGPDIAETRMPPMENGISGRPHLPSDSREIYIQPQDLLKSRHNTTFKPGRSQYHVSTRRYFV